MYRCTNNNSDFTADTGIVAIKIIVTYIKINNKVNNIR